MKKILVISESIDVNDSSGSKVNVALIKNLVLVGYSVKVLHYTRKDIFIDDIECISIKENKLSINYFLSRVQRVLQRLFKTNFSELLENIFGHSFTFFNDTKSIANTISNHYSSEDLIITLSKGASFRPHYAMLKLPELHTKWLAYVHDPFPFHYYPRPYNWVEKGYKFKENFFSEVSEKARYSAFPSQLLKEWMGSYFPNFLNTGVIIPHQLENFDTNVNLELPKYFNKDEFTLLHAGNLMMPRNPKFLIKAFKKFLTKNPSAKIESKLLFLGPSNYYGSYLNSQINSNIFWNGGYESYETVREIQNLASVNIILEAKSEISPFLPGKFPECVNAQKPILVLGPYYSEVRRLLGQDYEYLSESNDVDKITLHIERLYKNWKENINFSINKDINNYLSPENLKRQLEKLI